MGNSCNQREDHDKVSEDPRVSGVRLAVVVSPKKFKGGLPTDRWGRREFLSPRRRKWRLQQIVARRMARVEQAYQARLAIKACQRARERLIKSFLVRRLLPTIIFQAVEGWRVSMLDIALMQSSSHSMMERLITFFIEAVNEEEGIEARTRLMESLQQDLDNLQHRSSLPIEHHIRLFDFLDETTEEEPRLSGLATEIVLVLRRELRRANPVALKAYAEELIVTEGRRRFLSELITSRARTKPLLLAAVDRWLRYDGGMPEFEICLSLMGDVQQPLRQRTLTEARFRELAPEIRMDLLTKNNGGARNFAEFLRERKKLTPSL